MITAARLRPAALVVLGLFILRAHADRPYPLLPDTPPYVCEHLIYGEKHGTPYDGTWFRRIRRMMHWRYDVEFIGFEETLGRKDRGGAFLISNHSTPADPAVVLTAIGDRTAIRPLVTGNLRFTPGLAPIFNATNAFLQPEPIDGGRTNVTLLKALIAEMTNAVRHGDHVLFYPSGFAQTQKYDHLEAQTMVHRILALDPSARFVLLRQRGLWGSSFSHGAWISNPDHKVSTNFAIGRGLLNGLRIAGTNGPLTPKRRVTFEFVEPADFPRDGGVREINAYLTRFYGEGEPEERTFVKGHFLLPWRSPRTTDEDIDYGRAPQRWARAVADPTIPVDAHVRATLVDILRTEFDLGEDADFAGALDSIARVDLFLAIEDRLGVRLHDDAGFGDVDDLARQVAVLRRKPHPIERAVEASAPWFAPATNVDQPFWSRPVGRAEAIDLATNLKTWPAATVGVLRPLDAPPTIMEWALEHAGKTALVLDPGEDGARVRRRLDDAGVTQILTTPEYLRAVASSFDLAEYFERFVHVNTLERHR